MHFNQTPFKIFLVNKKHESSYDKIMRKEQE